MIWVDPFAAWNSRHFKDRARLQKRVDAVSTVFPAKARELEPSPGRLRIVGHAVDHNSAGPYLRGYAFCARHVSTKHGGVKTVAGIVGDSDRVFVGVISNHAEHGPENFLTGDCHVVRDIHEYCRLREVTLFEPLRLTLSADQHFGTFFDAFANVGLHAIVLLLRHHGPYGSLGIGWVADGECMHGFRDGALDRVELLARHEETRSRGASLAAVDKYHAERRWNRFFEIG